MLNKDEWIKGAGQRFWEVLLSCWELDETVEKIAPQSATSSLLA